ncbi:MAG TPA: addiction module protein [Thermoanaerobaculia bacterium]|nr:addiction module protein [Thermoanaerobaculia bacterium]
MARSKNLAVGSEFEKVREQALNLDLDARAALARALLESLEDLSEAENESLWLAEAERRQQEVREGRVKLVPGDDVKALLDRVLG